MNVDEARNLIKDYKCKKTYLNEEEEFEFVEALQYMIQNVDDVKYISELGFFYYRKKEYDLALKYLELAASRNDYYAYESLGYIWYYGRTGKRDYQIAFGCFQIAADHGILEARYKLADMYKNGYYVKKDQQKYIEIIEELFEELKDDQLLFDPVPEVCMRLGHIRKEQGNNDEALSLFFHARGFFVQRLKYEYFFGTFNNIRWAVTSIYALIPFDENDFDLFDLYYLCKRPIMVSFYHHGHKYYVKAISDDDTIVINYDGKWYRDIHDFMLKAKLGDNILAQNYNDLYYFMIEENDDVDQDQ